jgi:glycosyltransferase involved in cell wall biosynthesis
VLIEAVARANHRDRIHVSIVGGGPERDPLIAQAASRGVSSCFTFVGTVPATEMPQRVSDADVFVLSSRSEGRPNVVVEALAAGLPVISTNLEGVQGMVMNGDTGWLVAVDDADALAAALDQAITDRAELHRRGDRARVVARTQSGTWTDTARCYAALFRSALAVDGKGQPSCAE